MKTSIKEESPLIAVVLLPFIYLAYIWNHLPDKVPIHWNVQGEIDNYGTKLTLLMIPILLPLLNYLLFLLIPIIDPKGKIKNMGDKLKQIKTLLTIFMSILALFILYAVKNQSIGNPNYILMSIGLLFIILGNYFQTIKPNFFLGIRTPWTLHSETVWKATHKIGGKLWFVGGLLIVLFGMILSPEVNLIVFLSISAIITLVPMLYSYLLFKKEPVDVV